MTFNPHGALMINRGNRIWIVFYLYCCRIKKHKVSTIHNYSECCEPGSFRNVINFVCCIFYLSILYRTGLLLLGYSKHKLSTVYMYSLKKKSYFTHTSPWPNSPLHNCHFLQSPRWPLLIGWTVLMLPTEMLIRHRLTNRQCQIVLEIQRINN